MAKFNQTASSLLNDSDEFLENEECDADDDATVADESRRLVLSRDHFYRPLSMDTFPRSFLSPPIRSDFLENFFTGSLSTEDCRIIGFREQTSRPELIERTVLEVAGTVLAAQLAMRYGLASNLAGGTHHADSHRGKGYTIINDLAVAARLMTWRKGDINDPRTPNVEMLHEFYRGGRAVDRVLVVDCDVHQGDGTATFSAPPTSPPDCENSLHNRLFTLDLHAANNYPHPKEICTYDIGLLDGCEDETYLSELAKSLERALGEVRPQLVLFNAGVDVFESDKLGRLSLTHEGIRRRDSHVIRTCVDRGIPVAAVIGGGYDNDVKVLGRRHALVHRVCEDHPKLCLPAADPTITARVTPTLPPGSLGQNFLRDGNTVAKFVRAFVSDSSSSSSVDGKEGGGVGELRAVELGQGAGALMDVLVLALLTRDDSDCCCIKIDARSVELLRGKHPNLEVIHRDVLHRALAKEGSYRNYDSEDMEEVEAQVRLLTCE
ncbi:hypothetical protein ACHAW5_008267 [Stephanodiscus triporus]|uniref:Histone deacetylase domain-containing protein n=1 Tax=Stephanodiscus triporus TaxID=2934178 RepID=A0ABD3MNN7_9STRA